MAKYYFLDMETMDTESTAVILSMAILCVPDDIPSLELNEYNFNRIKQYGKYWKLDRISQQKLGRTVSKDTFEWWKHQSLEAKEVLSSKNCNDVKKSLIELHKFLEDTNFNPSEDFIWSRRIIDSIWYQSLCKSFNVECVMPYYRFLDTATALHCLVGNFYGSDRIKKIDITKFCSKHNCLDDCVLDYFRTTII